MPSRPSTAFFTPGAAAAPLILAIDVGTSSVRAGLYDRRGRLWPASEAALPYQPDLTAAGGASVDADRLARLVFAVLDRTAAQAARMPARCAIAAVGVSTFWHSLLGVASHGRPLTPVLLWADLRSNSALSTLRRRLAEVSPGSADPVDAYHQRTGAPLHPSFWPSKLSWLAETQPRAFAVARWMSFADYLYLLLFGATHTSISMASATGVWNRAGGTWDALTLSACGVDPRQFPAVSDEPMTGLARRWARRWPALQCVPWFPAWGDGACANAGSGAVGANRLALTVGTSSALRAVVPSEQEFVLPTALWRYALDARRHLVGGALSEGGNVYQWLCSVLQFAVAGGRAPSDAQLERRLARLPPDGHGLTFLPFLAGERSPGWRPHSRALLAGLSLATRPDDIARAGLEAVALQLAILHDDLLALLDARRRRARATTPAPGWEVLAGGAALHHSALWTQIIADAFGAPLTRLAVPETSARGAALLAAERLGWGALEAAPVFRQRRFAPHPRAVEIYRAARRRQRAAYQRQVAGASDS